MYSNTILDPLAVQRRRLAQLVAMFPFLGTITNPKIQVIVDEYLDGEVDAFGAANRIMETLSKELDGVRDHILSERIQEKQHAEI